MSTKVLNHYVDNQEFFDSIKRYQAQIAAAIEQGQEPPGVPNDIGKAILLIAQNLATKSNFANYSYRDEMVSDAVINCIRVVGNFDETKSKNPFAYFTTICYFAFIRRIKQEKAEQEGKYKLLQNSDFEAIVSQEHQAGEFDSGILEQIRQQMDLLNIDMSPKKTKPRKKADKGELPIE